MAGATLAAAALFQPARRRIQRAVDLDTLSAELLAVVDQTVQPTRAWFWTLPRPYQEARTRAWPPEPSS